MNLKFTLTSASLATGIFLLQAGIVGNTTSFMPGLKGRDAEPVTKNLLKKGPNKSVALYGNQCADAEKYGELTLLLEEDFSLMTAGSEEAPDPDTVLEMDPEDPDYQYLWNNMKPGFTHGDGRWGTGGVFSAGGMIYMANDYGNDQAHIVTPLLDLSGDDGTFVVELRAKARGCKKFPILMIEAAETNNWSPTWDMFETDAVYGDLPDQWITYRAVFRGGGPTTLINIVTTNIIAGDNPYEPTIIDGGLLIDDIKVYKVKPFVEAPKLLSHREFKNKSFLACWEPVANADSYLVSVSSTDEEGNSSVLFTDKETTETSMRVENIDPKATYYYQVKAKSGEHVSLPQLPQEVYDIEVPTLEKAEAVAGTEHDFIGKIAPSEAAIGYGYAALAKRTAEEDGPFVITNLDFNGWRNPALDEMTDIPELTIEDPWDNVSSLYYAHDIPQQGWAGYNMMTYQDFLCLDPYHYEMRGETVSWESPEMDLSKDGGKISIDLKLAGKKSEYYDAQGNRIVLMAKCVVGLFNWNEELEDYEEVETVTIDGLRTKWQDFHVDLTKGSERSVISFFAVGSLDNMYVDDIVIKQNYKKGETFLDPFYYCPWYESAEYDEPNRIPYTVPGYASGMEVYNRATATRAIPFAYGGYQGVASSKLSGTELVGSTPWYSGIGSITLNPGNGSAALDGNRVIVNNPDGRDVNLYYIDGKRVSALGNAQNIVETVSQHGIYIVTIGNKSIKLIY